MELESLRLEFPLEPHQTLTNQPIKHEPWTHNSFCSDWDRDSIVFALIEKTRTHNSFCSDWDRDLGLGFWEMDLDEEGRT